MLHRKKGVTSIKPNDGSYDITQISVATSDLEEFKEGRGFIARNDDNKDDMWFINTKYYGDNYEVLF
jgi:hypothetical protein